MLQCMNVDLSGSILTLFNQPKHPPENRGITALSTSHTLGVFWRYLPVSTCFSILSGLTFSMLEEV